MADPNWKPCVHSVQPRLVYLPPTVKTGAPWAGTQDFSIERILAADSSNSRRTLGASALSAGADCVSTIPRNFSLEREVAAGIPGIAPDARIHAPTCGGKIRELAVTNCDFKSRRHPIALRTFVRSVPL